MDSKPFSSIDDIPEAQRDGQAQLKPTTGRRLRRWLVWFLVGLLSAVAGLVVSWLTYPTPNDTPAIALQPLVGSAGTTDNTPAVVLNQGDSPEKSILGHRAYEEAPAAELVALTYDEAIRLRPPAANQLEAMIANAEAQGIYLVPLSGFRSVDDQQYLFFDVKAERGQTAETRAEVSAPPGYSEHHTGYAIDIGDANFPDTHLQVSFETTPAFQWLDQNATRYSFELSFPEGNAQGIQYEPWHWRFVGDPNSLETFYQDR